ncbi:malonyl-CoA decarboxylase [Spongiibacter sp. KMU-158]|uniref:Malonyl-CoA decarboxylase n=1 Tax=Spongiibacter pelagi TaxID=2760804 RepID=A0A927GW79_9GAMM|nr:malonyl-CoA decarboxylase [Spongiibacter pelagi]MBD2859441.1 malonyl-CoA decarboxylase [Spongiibacter pelagi]
MAKFSDWVSSIADAGRELLPGKNRQGKQRTLIELCHEACTSKGEAMGTAIADAVVRGYQSLDQEERIAFFQQLHREFGANPDEILRCAEAFKQSQSIETYRALSEAIDPPRRKVFRAINMAPNGTATLIQMRKDVLALLKDHPEFVSIDDGLKNLFISWFNRGFLTLERISWKTSADILEKLIAYEAVHEMDGWDDLRRRLASDRRCFAFFHPAMEDEPLIFVQVALVKGVAGNVQEILEAPMPEVDDHDFDSAIFYSISNCQDGLKGISFGNFLIKQVVVELQREFPQLKKFATLSPIPGFRRWLDGERSKTSSPVMNGAERQVLELLKSPTWMDDASAVEQLEPLLMRLCAHYLHDEKRGAEPLDPVARFHLGNGAAIARLNWLGDRSENGLRQSCGVLVNYAYLLENVEQNHEAYVNEGQVATLSAFQKLLQTP